MEVGKSAVTDAVYGIKQNVNWYNFKCFWESFSRGEMHEKTYTKTYRDYTGW